MRLDLEEETMKDLLKKAGTFNVYVVFRNVNYIPKRKEKKDSSNEGIKLRKGDLVLIPVSRPENIDYGVYNFSHAGNSNFHPGDIRQQARTAQYLLNEGHLNTTDSVLGKVVIADKELDFPVFGFRKFLDEFAKR